MKKPIVEINLLRRERKRIIRKEARLKLIPEKWELDRNKLILAAIVFIFVLGFVGYNLKLNSNIRKNKHILEVKRQELRSLKKVYLRIKKLEAERAEIQSKIEVISKLSSGRGDVKRVFQEIENTVPSKSWISELGLKSNSITLKGYTLEDNDVADFIENILKTGIMSNCKLGYIKKSKFKGYPLKEFALSVQMK